MKDLLTNRIEALIAELPLPVYCIGHNLSLGKNVALSAAFEEVTKRMDGWKNIRFFSVIHDLAEEGRVTLMKQIRYLESLAIPVWTYLYPQNNVHYIVLNKRNYTLFTRAGFPVTLLPNPLEAVQHSTELSAANRRAVTACLIALSRRDKTCFNPSATTFFYPVRVISRKNILEAVMVACLIHKGNLLVGGYGTSPGDIALFNTIKCLAQQYHLPVILDVMRLRHHLPKMGKEKGDIFSLLYRYADKGISTSISEGFGYALFEPWLYGKGLIGRLPLGIASDEWCDFSHLYSRFEIPVSWISLKELTCQYRKKIRETFGWEKKEVFPVTLPETFLTDRYIDFGVLSQKMQLDILKKVFMSGKEGGKDTFLRGGPYEPKRETIDKNRSRLQETLTGETYDTRFKESFFHKRQTTKKNAGDRLFFTRYFSSVEKYRLLMTPVKKEIKKKK